MKHTPEFLWPHRVQSSLSTLPFVFILMIGSNLRDSGIGKLNSLNLPPFYLYNVIIIARFVASHTGFCLTIHNTHCILYMDTAQVQYGNSATRLPKHAKSRCLRAINATEYISRGFKLHTYL